MATSIKLPEDLKKRIARAEFQRSGTGYALAEVKAHYRAKLQGRRSRKPTLLSLQR